MILAEKEMQEREQRASASAERQEQKWIPLFSADEIPLLLRKEELADSKESIRDIPVFEEAEMTLEEDAAESLFKSEEKETLKSSGKSQCLERRTAC